MGHERLVGHERITTVRFAAALAGLSVCAGCGRNQEAQEQPSFRPLIAQEEVVIDGYDADLVPISRMAVSPEDRIFVAQEQESTIRVFEADGMNLLQLGGRGEGPGEFRAIYRMGFLHDTLWVLDNRIGRVSLYSPSLDLLRTEVRPPSGFASLEFVGRFFALLPDGSWNSRLDVPAGSWEKRRSILSTALDPAGPVRVC